jgi:hypothetical protein
MAEAFFIPMKVTEKMGWQQCIFSDHRHSKAARLVAAALINCHNTLTGRLDPAVEHLMVQTGLSRRGVIMARDELVDTGYLIKLQRSRSPSGRGNRSNAYRLVVPTDKTGASRRERTIEHDVISDSAVTASRDDAVAARQRSMRGAAAARSGAVSAPRHATTAPEPVKEPINKPSSHPHDETLRDEHHEVIDRFRAFMLAKKGAFWVNRWCSELVVLRIENGLLVLQAPKPAITSCLQYDVTLLRLAACHASEDVRDAKIVSATK